MTTKEEIINLAEEVGCGSYPSSNGIFQPPLNLQKFAERVHAAGKREAAEWRKADTPPEELGSYLVWSKTEGMETLWFQLKDGGTDGRKAGNWYGEDEPEDDWPKNWRVTHWMPLPEPPVEELK